MSSSAGGRSSFGWWPAPQLPVRERLRAAAPTPWLRPSRLAALALALPLLMAGTAAAASLEDISTLERLVNAAGVVTLVADDCPPRHAGFYERDAAGRHRLVLCRNGVDLGDVEAVWEVMAHEATHIMQACRGGSVIADDSMPRTIRELRTMAPHYAKLIDRSYAPADQRLEAEAFWMELQTPGQVISLFRRLCGSAGVRR
ncbi:MAG: hypothetical protein VKN15_03485 [Cyanobacteriota bacterium]|nr:hypothetical protein [Cyanobacteriota bacterium]